MILAFGWLTGTQLFLSFVKVSKSETIKVLLALISTFIIILFTYEFIGLTLEHFIYGDNAFLFYEAATLNVTLLTSLLVLALIMIVGWSFIYKQHLEEMQNDASVPGKMRWSLYQFLAKEGYYFEFLNKFKRDRA